MWIIGFRDCVHHGDRRSINGIAQLGMSVQKGLITALHAMSFIGTGPVKNQRNKVVDVTLSNNIAGHRIEAMV